MGERADSGTVRGVSGALPEGLTAETYCRPEKISRYVEDEKRRHPEKFIKAPPPPKVRNDKSSQFKECYAMCADYNEELGYLAVCLIDRQVILYKLKVGQKVQFAEFLKFWPPHLATCCSIERGVSDSRPILVMGCKDGYVQIYYIDPPVTDPDTRQFVVQTKAQEHPIRNFDFFRPQETQAAVLSGETNQAAKAKRSGPRGWLGKV